MSNSADLISPLSVLLQGKPVAWEALNASAPDLMAACIEEGLTSLVYQRAKALPSECGWPRDVLDDMARRAHAEAAVELVLAVEIRGALDDLATAGVRPVLLKGTSLAYTIYDDPGLRPRGDSDILIRKSDAETTRRILEARGYRLTPHCDDLFSQFEMQKRCELGVTHTFDVHWNISTQPVFAHVLTFDEFGASAGPVPALGAQARTAGLLHALLLACMHPVMHHQNVERLLWIYDVHLLASRLSHSEWETFIDMARDKQMAAVCAHELELARRTFDTAIPDTVESRLTTIRGERSAAYLRARRRWHHEQASILGAMSGWRARARHVRGVLLPKPQYVLDIYGFRLRPFGVLLLPALYIHRNINGFWKILLGRK